MENTTHIGIDLGTSGCRAVAISATGTIAAEAAVPLPGSRTAGVAVEQSPEDWWQGIETLLPRLLDQVDLSSVRSMAVDGTSGTVLLADAEGRPRTPALMYNDNRAVEQAGRIAACAPRESAAHGTGSALAKLLWLLDTTTDPLSLRAHTQADWISGKLCDRFGLCDSNNALKLGYDPVAQRWPSWLEALALPTQLLPQVVPPSTPISPIAPSLAERWGLPASVMICSGTTDSTAAFIASGASAPGEAVTSLGSTLVLKVLAEEPVFAPEYGIYSQPLGDYWLVGGGSNSGGAVLRHFFSDTQMAELTGQIQPDNPCGLNYYPLLRPGERFPINDSALAPRLTPRPSGDACFFQAMLEGIAAIEKAGYERLAQLGAPYPASIRSIGGGARNTAWTAIRARELGVSMRRADAEEACYGTAILATRCGADNGFG